MAVTWSQAELDDFHKAAQSLKLYRRADLQDDDTGSSLIEELYVDPLPNNHVLQTTIKPNTTFLIGRKGTGKSTVFQRAQHELRKSNSSISVYIDIKTVFESSQVDPLLLEKANTLSTLSASAASLRKLMLYKAFLNSVITDIKSELKNRIKKSRWERLKQTFLGSLDDLFTDLNELLEDANHERFMSVIGVKTISVQADQSFEERAETQLSAGMSGGPSPKIDLSANVKDTLTHVTGEKQSYADVLMAVFDVKELLLRLKDLLSKISVQRLYIFVDDFSELPEEAMGVVVDTLLAPLNNWSEELIKFKIAAYPGRVYYGNIDKTKIDEISLDLYSLYGVSDVAAMEEKAVDFTRRIIERRIEYFCGSSLGKFFSQSQIDLWQSIFYATMANPRNIGYLLFYLYESQLIYGNLISARAIREAARKYYEEKIEPYFAMNKFLHETFNERSSIFSLKELLEALVRRARELRSHQGSAIMSELKEMGGRPPTSHFHVLVSMENLLSTLELNFFLTRYFEMSDRDGRKVSIFALNYGLCQKYTIEFGRPRGRREFRTYFVERIFDYTPILLEYMKANQEIVCETCSERFSVEQLTALQMYGMKCPKCTDGICTVTNLSKKYESVLNAIAPELLLPKTELGILQTLRTEAKPMYAQQIAAELDCSYQLVGRRGKNLKERLLVERERDEQGRRQFSITPLAEKQYFDASLIDSLDVNEV